MKLLSLQVGQPREVTWEGKPVLTSIFKEPVEERVAAKGVNLNGDKQSDLNAHGGYYKAVYAYASEHYPYWREQLRGTELPWGAFGENLTTEGEGLLEDEVNIGDCFRIGTAELTVTQPRFPCFKLNIRLDRTDMIDRLLDSGRSGIYFAITKEGELGAGDAVELVSRDPLAVRVSDIVSLYRDNKDDTNLLYRASQVEALPDFWRERFSKRLAKLSR